MISNKRIIIVLVLFGATFLAMQFFSDVKPTPILQPLNTFPEKIENWKLSQKGTLSQKVSDVLGVDDYLDYTYTDSRGKRMDLYVSYFSALGVSGLYHSPQNCMPGAGWNISSLERIPIRYAGDSNAEINKMVMVNGANRMLVYYWFQNRGRIIASEYWDKIYTVLDGIFMRRRDGSFIRVMSYENDDQAAIDFSQKIAAELDDYLPGR